MRVDVANAASKQRKPIDEIEHLVIGGCGGLRKILKFTQKYVPSWQVAQREFADHERMTQNLAGL